VDDKDYQVPFAFSGKINKITLTIDRPKLTPADEKKLMASAAEQQGERVVS
jgi:arylsulfatase